MSEESYFELLREKRPLLLVVEAIGWLHLTRKANRRFLENHAATADSSTNSKNHSGQRPSQSLDNLLKDIEWVKEFYPKKTNTEPQNGCWPASMECFLTKDAKQRGSKGLLGLLQAGHAMASGIEKQSYPEKEVKYLQQNTKNMWLNSAFGFPERNLLGDDIPELLTDQGWKDLLGEIKVLLKELSLLGKSALQAKADNLDKWWKWRDGAVGSEGWLRRLFTETLAETRLPNNDITLFDQSYVAAALFKSAAAGTILNGKFGQTCDKPKKKTRWRLLTVGIGADHYEARSVKIGDLVGAQKAVQDFFRKVCRLIEVDLAVGSLLYEDSEVRVFSFPGEPFTNDEGKYSGNRNNSHDDSSDSKSHILSGKIDTLMKSLTAEIDKYAKDANFETPPYCGISEPSRSLTNMRREIERAKKTMAVPLHKKWEIADKNTSEGHVCPVCLVRCNGNRDDKQILCDVCKERRTGRLNEWLEGELDTIWISELADSNDRLALVTMNLEIEPWLNGSRLDSLRAQAISKWYERNRSINGSGVPFERLVKYIEKQLNKIGKRNFNNGDETMKSLNGGYRGTNSWEEFYGLIVADRSDSPEWNNIDNNTRARWFVHQLFCKLASPGRVYRFQRQSEEFFKDLLAEFRKIISSDTDIWRTRRLVIEPEECSLWNDKQIYNGLLGDTPIDLLYRERDGFLTLCNLSRLSNSVGRMDSLKGQELELCTEKDTSVRKLKIRSVGYEAGKLRSYCPVIPLEISPVRFRLLLPLESVSDCIDLAIDQWNEKFNRVWDRLPLRIGVVAFSRKTPFQTVIATARSVEDGISLKGGCAELWEIKESVKSDVSVSMVMTGPDKSSVLRKEMHIKFPDNSIEKKEDLFYPYLSVEGKDICFDCDFQHPGGQIYRHVKDLRTGDKICVSPSLVTTVYLDNATRRFEPFVVKRIDEWNEMREMWIKIDKAVPSRAALRSAWSELVERRRNWQDSAGLWFNNGKDAWLELVRTVFRVRLKVRDTLLNSLVEAAGNGLLEWSLEWHMGVLKEGLTGSFNKVEVNTEGDK
jgi:CRISPR-associated Csx11 family protein